MNIQAIITTGLLSEYLELLKGLKLENHMEIHNDCLILEVLDPDTFPDDCKGIQCKVDEIIALHRQIAIPWLVCDIVEGKAIHTTGGNIVYSPSYAPKTIREYFELVVGEITNYEYENMLSELKDSVSFEKDNPGFRTSIDEIVKIAAAYAKIRTAADQ